MRPSSIVACVALAGAAAAGCEDDTLTCAWLASAANCWSNTAVAAQSCLPPDTENGTFSADNSTCNYASGSVVNFTPAVVLPLPQDPNWNFTVNAAGGQACLHYEKTGNGMKLVVGADTVNIGGSGLEESISCPDGSSVKTSNALDLLSCPGSIGALPGAFTGYTDTSVSFGLIGIADPSMTVRVFDCTK